MYTEEVELFPSPTIEKMDCAIHMSHQKNSICLLRSKSNSC